MSPEPFQRSGVPPELLDWMERYGGTTPKTGGEALAEAALRALDYAVARPGREREAAFALLAADALMTTAVEHLLEADDPQARLEELVERISSEGLGER